MINEDFDEPDYLLDDLGDVPEELISEEDVLAIAYDCDALPENMTVAGLVRFANALFARCTDR